MPEAKPLEREVPRRRGRDQRKFSNYLIDKSLQLRYVGLVTTISMLLAGGLGYLVWLQERRASQSIISTLESSEFPRELQRQVIDRLAKGDNELIILMAVVGVALVIVLSAYLVLMTHKVAGPLFKVSKYFDEMAEGRLSPIYPLRRGDMLVGFFNRFKDTHETVRRRQTGDMDKLEALLAAVGDRAQGTASETLDDARNYLARRREQLS